MATRVKAGHKTPEWVGMHDGKRPKWRKTESGRGASAMQESWSDLQIQETGAGLHVTIAPSAGLRATQDMS
jgi:hypothetical protein